MEIQTEYFDQVALVVLEGRIDNTNLIEFEMFFNEILERNFKNIVLDLSDLNLISGNAIRTLVRAWINCRKRGGDLKIANPSKAATVLLGLEGSDQIFHVYSDATSAVESFALG